VFFYCSTLPILLKWLCILIFQSLEEHDKEDYLKKELWIKENFTVSFPTNCFIFYLELQFAKNMKCMLSVNVRKSSCFIQKSSVICWRTMILTIYRPLPLR